MVQFIKHMWTLNEAQELIEELEPSIRELNYHTMLGGSVLHKRWSEKDLDLFFSPLNGYESDTRSIVVYLMSKLGNYKEIRDSPDYDGSPFHWKEALMFTYQDRRIDVFIE